MGIAYSLGGTYPKRSKEKAMKKRFKAPVLVDASSLAELTLGTGAVCVVSNVQACG